MLSVFLRIQELGARSQNRQGVASLRLQIYMIRYLLHPFPENLYDCHPHENGDPGVCMVCFELTAVLFNAKDSAKTSML